MRINRLSASEASFGPSFFASETLVGERRSGRDSRNCITLSSSCTIIAGIEDRSIRQKRLDRYFSGRMSSSSDGKSRFQSSYFYVRNHILLHKSIDNWLKKQIFRVNSLFAKFSSSSKKPAINKIFRTARFYNRCLKRCRPIPSPNASENGAEKLKYRENRTQKLTSEFYRPDP